MRALGNLAAMESVMNALFAVFWIGPVLALVGLYVSPVLALGAFFIQIAAGALYFAVKLTAPQVKTHIESHRRRSEERRRERDTALATPHAV